MRCAYQPPRAVVLAALLMAVAACTVTPRRDYARTAATFAATLDALIILREEGKIRDERWEQIYAASVIADRALDAWQAHLLGMPSEPAEAPASQRAELAAAERAAINALTDFDREARAP